MSERFVESTTTLTLRSRHFSGWIFETHRTWRQEAALKQYIVYGQLDTVAIDEHDLVRIERLEKIGQTRGAILMSRKEMSMLKMQGSRYKQPTVDEPDFSDLEEQANDGVVETTDGCYAEADGYCSHEYPSWLIELGLI